MALTPALFVVFTIFLTTINLTYVDLVYDYHIRDRSVQLAMNQNIFSSKLIRLHISFVVFLSFVASFRRNSLPVCCIVGILICDLIPTPFR
ncbi:hypothetical protein L873DRAFT_649092 [Choiromyces venosus 120613-1]|uniref:Uncharacterized protein n=1 Tax=Choiromyces venosus 120613-1 TaxID=1336337 RepID=A0A3N4IZ78_9PEZI|nr:hypothetical protein L873DRAFT_649092 [Choiromyces venosus 120613-1]